MKIRNVLLGAAASLLVAGTASADYTSPTGWYMSLGAGANWLEDGLMKEIETGVFDTAYTYSFNDGYIVSGSIGYDFGDHWRVEFEVAHRDNDADWYVYTNTPSSGSADAEVAEFSQMVNVLYDFQLGGNWEATVGAGIGGNLVTWSFGNSEPEYDDYVLAGQLIGGVSYQFASRWKAFADYRYMIMDDPDFLELDNPVNNYTLEKTDHSLLVGLRFDLQRDGAAPERPRETGGAPKQFIVFFGFNKSNLTAEAARVVTEAAAAAKKYGSASISVVGHTDTVGSNDYNMRLSMRRSQAVKDGLMANGIAADMITTGGRGEAELMVQTGDSVKEPQNRRATIDLK